MTRLAGAWGRASFRLRKRRKEDGDTLQYRYDPEADALSIILVPNAKSAKTIELDEARRVDLDSQGNAVAIEVLWVSDGFNLRDIVERFSLWDHEIALKEIQNMQFAPALRTGRD